MPNSHHTFNHRDSQQYSHLKNVDESSRLTPPYIIVDDTRKICNANIRVGSREDSVSDCSHVSPQIMFLQTPQNEKFIPTLPQHIKVIQRDSLKDYFNTQIKIIGITGTNGKTTTAAAIYSLLLDSGYRVALLGTRGMFMNDEQIKPKGLTTPALLELYEDIHYAAQAKCQYFIMEVSSHAIKQERIYGLDFYMKILTNITSDHLDYHKTWEDYAATKLGFLESGNSIKIINLDEKSATKMRFLSRVFSYGIESKGNLFVNAYSLTDGIFAQTTLRLPSLEHITQDSQYTNSQHVKKGVSEVQNTAKAAMTLEEATLQSHLFGLFNLYNFLAAALTVKIITKKPLQEIYSLFVNFGGVAGRMEIVSMNPLIIIDFAHTTDGMKQVLEGFKMRDISVVFGAGGDRDKSKRSKMGACAASYAHRIYITNDNPRSENPHEIAQEIFNGVLQTESIARGIQTKIILDREEAIATAIRELPQDSVLFILGKGDESIQIFKDTQVYFSDKECVQKLLKEIQPT